MQSNEAFGVFGVKSSAASSHQTSGTGAIRVRFFMAAAKHMAMLAGLAVLGSATGARR